MKKEPKKETGRTKPVVQSPPAKEKSAKDVKGGKAATTAGKPEAEAKKPAAKKFLSKEANLKPMHGLVGRKFKKGERYYHEYAGKVDIHEDVDDRFAKANVGGVIVTLAKSKMS